MVRKNKGKKKKGGGGRTTAPKVNNNSSSSTRVRAAAWPKLDEYGCWKCTNCNVENCDSIRDFSPHGTALGICAACGHDEMDEKFAVLIIPILKRLQSTGLLCGKKSPEKISVDDRSTWVPSILEAVNEKDQLSSLKINLQVQQLHELINIRAAVNDVKPGIGGLVRAKEMIVQCKNKEHMKYIAKTTMFRNLSECIQYYFDQKCKDIASISSENNNNNEDSRTADDKKMGGDDDENTDQQSINKSPLTQTDIDTRLVNQCINPLLTGLKDYIESWISRSHATRVEELRLLLGVLDSDNITSNPRTVIQAQLQYVQLTDDHLLDNRFSTLRDLANTRSLLKSDGIEMAAAKLEEASHKQHMKVISQEPLFQLLLKDMEGLVYEKKTKDMRDHIYQLVQQVQPEHALEITDMLMELETSERFHLLNHPEILIDKIHEAAERINSKTNKTDSLESNITGMESFEPEPVEFNQSWQSDNDILRRRVMVKCM